MKKLFYRLTALILTACLLLIPASALSVEQARQLLDQYHIEDLPEQAMQAQTMEELIAALNDPYTTYLSQEEYEKFVGGINDTQQVGIGVSVEIHEKGVLIASVLDNSPALESGLVAGDVITAVNGTTITTVDEATALIAGPEGSTVRITVLRADGSTVDFDLVRRKFTVPSTVQYQLSADGNAGIIVCNSFGDATASHFNKALKEYAGKVNTWIVDLTSNPGGTSSSAQQTIGSFLGLVISFYFLDGSGKYSMQISSASSSVRPEEPVIILTSPYTASASELFAGAMRDNAGGIAIGQRTLGKGVAQIILDKTTHPDLFDGDGLKLTHYRFYSPTGASNDQIGIFPTLLISPENTYAVSLLLSGDKPAHPSGHLKLTLCGHDFYINIASATGSEYRPAFVELLEALPPSAQLFQHMGDGLWTKTTPERAALSMGLSEFSPRTFTDLEGYAEKDPINTLAAFGLVGGYGDGTFHPDDSISRAEFCAMLGNLLDLYTPGVTQSSFDDVAPDAWYSGVVHAMHELGYLGGYGDGTFRPEQTITQEEMVSILAKIAPKLNMHIYDFSRHTPGDNELTPFYYYSQWAQRSAWILSACNVDLTVIAPQYPANRAQAASMMYQLLSNCGLFWQ